MSITDELREWAKKLTHWWYDPVKDEYTYTTGTMPPSIDAIRLDSNIIAIADRIDAEHERATSEFWAKINAVPATDENMAEHGWIRLPKGADGKYIHMGDKMECFTPQHPDVPKVFEVQRILMDDVTGWRLVAYPATYVPEECRHYHAPTVEDVLCDLLNEYRENECTLEEARLSEYAAKLRLAEEDA